MIHIYTDGAARGNPGPGGWAAIIASEDTVREIGGSEVHTTNNRMELTAAIEAIDAVKEGEVTIYTDSEYVMKGMTLWIHSWQKKGWKTAQKKPVLNQDLWQKLLSVTENKVIDWKYVRGHVGHETNERADELATAFADRKDPDLYNGPRNTYKYL